MQCRRPWFNSWVGKTPWRKDRLPTPVFLGFLCGSAGKEFACNAGGLDSIPGLGRSSGEGKGYPLQYSALENSMDYMAHGVAKSQTHLSHFYLASLQNKKNYRRKIKYSWASLIAQLVNNPLEIQETPVQFLGQEDPLEKV